MSATATDTLVYVRCMVDARDLDGEQMDADGIHEFYSRDRAIAVLQNLLGDEVFPAVIQEMSYIGDEPRRLVVRRAYEDESGPYEAMAYVFSGNIVELNKMAMFYSDSTCSCDLAVEQFIHKNRNLIYNQQVVRHAPLRL